MSIRGTVKVAAAAVGWVLAIVAGATLPVLLSLTTGSGAGAGIAPGGYAQIAQHDLNHDHQVRFYGYTARCRGSYSNYATAQVKIVCYLNEP